MEIKEILHKSPSSGWFRNGIQRFLWYQLDLAS